MADWYGVARTNYVKIKDIDGLKKSLKLFPISIHKEDDGDKYCFVSEEYFGAWPTSVEDEDSKEILFSFKNNICLYMEEGEVLIVMEVGNEKARYLSGYAEAYNSKGDYTSISLDDIYEKAAEKFGVPRDKITGCNY